MPGIAGHGHEQAQSMKAAPVKARILVVDDDERIRRICKTFLEKIGHQVTVSEGAQAAIGAANEADYDIVLTDIRMPDISGDVLIRRLRDVRPELAAVIMTGYPTMELAIDAVSLGVYEFLTKPFKLAELDGAVQKVLERRAADQSRIERQFVERLFEMEKSLGEDFDLHNAVESLLAVAEAEAPEEKAEEKTEEKPQAERAVATPVPEPGIDPAKPLFVVVCEPVPRDRKTLQAAPNYHHFRTIYAAHRVLNSQLAEGAVGAEVKLVMASHSADIPKHFRRYADQICCVIFGPNLPRLTEATVRMTANAGRRRHVVVCYNPDQVNFSWDALEDLSGRMEVWGCRSSADAGEIRSFWSRYFTQELRPLVETKVAPEAGEESETPLLSIEEIREKLARDEAVVDMLPGFPHICRQVIDAIDGGKRFADVATIIQPDGALQASILRTANLAKYGSRQRIEALPNALSMIGAEETKKIAMGRAMSDMMKRVDQAGFSTRDFFFHSTSVGYLAQLLSLNLEAPNPREREILKSLRVPNFVNAALVRSRLWERFDLPDSFDAFTAGILHDVGKVLNTVCYEGLFPLVLHEYETSQWQGSLIASEIAVVGDFQHPVTGGALLERWEIFPDLIEPIREHHAIGADSPHGAVLVALANSLAKSCAPFPRAIAIPDEYRKQHLKPVADEGLLDNPLVAAYRQVSDAYEAATATVELSPDERDSGEYAPEHVQALLVAGAEVAEGSDACGPFCEALVAQNPEFLVLAEWLETTSEELIRLTALVQGYVSELVNGLFQGTRAT